VVVKVSSHAFLSSAPGVENSALLPGHFAPKERVVSAHWNSDMKFEEKKGPLQKEKNMLLVLEVN